MTRTETALEFASVLRLLREHAFLRYSVAGCSEYEVKLRTAGDQFASIVSKASGIALANPYPYTVIEGETDPNADTVVRTIKRIGARLASASKKASDADAIRLAADAEAWRKASELIAKLPR